MKLQIEIRDFWQYFKNVMKTEYSSKENKVKNFPKNLTSSPLLA
jgi:hypothetical protein